MATKKEIKERLVNELVEEFTSKGVNVSRIKKSGADLVVLKKDDEEISTVDLGIFAETVKTYPSMQEVLTSAMKTSLAECLKRFDEIEEEDDDIDEDDESFEDIELEIDDEEDENEDLSEDDIEIDDDDDDDENLDIENVVPITIPDGMLPEMGGAYIHKVGAVSIGFIDALNEDMVQKSQVDNEEAFVAQAMRNIAREQVKISSLAEKVSDFSGFESPCWMNDFNDIYIVEVPVTSPICYKENIMARIAEIVGGCYAFVPLANGMIICSDSKLAPVFDKVSELYMQKDFKEYGFCVSHKWSFYNPEDEAAYVL